MSDPKPCNEPYGRTWAASATILTCHRERGHRGMHQASEPGIRWGSHIRSAEDYTDLMSAWNPR